MIEAVYDARSWILNHWEVIGTPLLVAIVLNALLPAQLVARIRHRLPDPVTGFHSADAFPIWPAAHVRLMVFVFSRRGMELSGPGGRVLIRMIRWLTVAQYITVFVLFFASATEGYVFDPHAEILKSDAERAIEAAGQSTNPSS